MMTDSPDSVKDLHAARTLIASLQGELAQRDALLVRKDHEIQFKQTLIDKFTQELAVYERLQYGKKSEQFQGEQGKLLLETIDTDMAAIELELAALRKPATTPDPDMHVPRRAQLPANLPRVDTDAEKPSDR